MFVLYVKSKVVYTQFNKSLNSKSFNSEMHSQKVITKIIFAQKWLRLVQSIDGKKMSYMYNGWGSEKLAAHTQ